ncbi:MAG: hypothetical protein OEV26_05020 [Gallionella sp.]|nr:hypothetical protein [Gallionella sp.]
MTDAGNMKNEKCAKNPRIFLSAFAVEKEFIYSVNVKVGGGEAPEPVPDPTEAHGIAQPRS